MRRIQVDFNALDQGVVPAGAPREPLSTGERVIIFDDSTDDYTGQVVGLSSSGRTVFVAVDEKARHSS